MTFLHFILIVEVIQILHLAVPNITTDVTNVI